MTPKQRATLKDVLTALRAEAVRAGPQKIQPNRTDDSSVGVPDEDAQALSEMHQALNSQRNRTQAELIGRIDKALRKLAAAPDDFGHCEDCEEDIPFKRLQLVPYATLCAECQGKRDPRRGTTRKKLTDYR